MAKGLKGKERGAAIELEDGFIVSWEHRTSAGPGGPRLRRFLQGSGRNVNREGFRGLGPTTVFVTGEEGLYFFRNFLQSCDADSVAWTASLGPATPS